MGVTVRDPATSSQILKGGTAGQGPIEGTEDEIVIGTLPITRYLVSKRAVSAFTLDVSELDGADLLGWA